MTPIEIIILIGSLILIISILYYFFGPKEDMVVAKTGKNVQTATIVVDGAFVPSELKLKAGIPAEVIFDRRDKGQCTDWVIFNRFPNEENLEIKSYLPEGKKTLVKFTPTKKGIYGFACGMGMNHGQLIVNK
ncbi:cupredoxin domain-containing protein [Candidatus Curtissbacteria bacterium]|nr:cupredoxin domain-containing protein [Candidatus Curtissbacteria bacterium]